MELYSSMPRASISFVVSKAIQIQSSVAKLISFVSGFFLTVIHRYSLIDNTAFLETEGQVIHFRPFE